MTPTLPGWVRTWRVGGSGCAMVLLFEKSLAAPCYHRPAQCRAEERIDTATSRGIGLPEALPLRICARFTPPSGHETALPRCSVASHFDSRSPRTAKLWLRKALEICPEAVVVGSPLDDWPPELLEEARVRNADLDWLNPTMLRALYTAGRSWTLQRKLHRARLLAYLHHTNTVLNHGTSAPACENSSTTLRERPCFPNSCRPACRFFFVQKAASDSGHQAATERGLQHRDCGPSSLGRT